MSIRALSTTLQEKAKAELNEVPERLQEDLKFIRDWLEKQPHLKVEKDDQWILSFLRSCKFSLPRTTEKLDFLFSLKSITPEFYEDRDPLSSPIQKILEKGIFIPVTNIEDGKPGKLLVIWRKTDPKTLPMIDLIKMVLMFIDILIIENDNFAVCGQEILHDMQDFPVEYVTHLTLAICKKSMLSLQKAYPIRLKKLWFFNASASYEIFINMFRQFVTNKMKDRMKVFRETQLSGIYKQADLDDFPVEYGGKNGHVDEIAAEWKIKLENYREWFLKDQDMKSDENRRVGVPKTYESVFGMEGSFRNLTID